ncbi:glycine cleavage system aminomethyltransferase GcvT [Chenggangzhangella methanolivorans]|uniref:aminomethyltransferase n=1 Tax=Chenggangzhangella methanolivorans TaxID=1437009 RepID=A0A9E6R9C7_9HYPH|nr:glycine cleavage system aminomethyltransferase GcvT [Chenggangzhangella methanolivorans]QZO00509.1 glycine cleavage system aminomethyltransferase GcvT [Chenggangzhangella methanolivorans]
MNANVQTQAGHSVPANERKRTPLHAMHARLGAKFCPFAGYEMPLHYPNGVLKEHLLTRSAAGLFDVSHMGQIALVPRSGDVDDAARALETLVPVDILGLKPGRQRYALFTSETGGVLDDLMVARLPDRLALVVNAATKDADEAHLRARLPDAIEVRPVDRALIAVQGPGAEAALAGLAPDAAAMRFMDAHEINVAGERCLVSRSGYTGEDGFEISLPNVRAESVAEALIAADVEPVGLGARDSLRLEAGLCLYGSDMDEDVTPIEASLGWAISPSRRPGGAREGGFPGADRILLELAEGAPRRRVGLLAEGRVPVRASAELFSANVGSELVGRVTSGGFGPSLNAPVAMGYVSTALSEAGQQLFADVRGRRLPVTVAKLPFVPAGFKRS